MKSKKVLAFALAATMTLSVGAISACGGGEEEKTSDGYSMEITEQVKEWKRVTKNGVTYYAAEGVVYCSNPTTKAKQSLNIYIPAEYMNDDGTINASGTRNGYTAATAPILYINSVGAYMGLAPYKISDTATTAGQNGWYYNYLNDGFVLAFAGARGRADYVSGTREALGKAPIGLADLKAGIRFLKHNDAAMPGDANKIISNGMSAGGAMSTLIGVSGNSTAFNSYLEEMGAVMDATDDVYAAQAYCPITDLDHADFAYEWFFKNDNSKTAQALFTSDFERALSAEFYGEYISYFNELGITVDGTTYSIGEDGRSGNFVDWLLDQYKQSYEVYKAQTGETAAAPKWISSIENIVANHNTRSKVCPSFDRLNMDASAAENGVFGSRDSIYNGNDYQRHFSVPVTSVIHTLIEKYAEAQSYYDAYNADSSLEDVKDQVALYNPYTYLNAKNTDVAQYFRICVGTKDSDTSPSVSAQLALTLMSLGVDTDYNLIWDFGHTDADYAGAYEAWVNKIGK